MSKHQIPFFTFDEAVKIVLDDPDTRLVGIHFVEPFSYLSVYVVNVLESDEPGEPGLLHIGCSGGALFSSSGEEGGYELEDTPAEARNLFYARECDLADGNPQYWEMNSEYVLHNLIPGVGRDTEYRSVAHFKKAAAEEFRKFWRQA